MKTLHHRSTIRTTDAPAHAIHVVITPAGKDAEYNRPGMHSGPPCVIRPASMLTTCTASHAQQDAERSACVVVTDGETVTIEGRAYVVQYRPGAWKYTDGIQLTRTA